MPTYQFYFDTPSGDVNRDVQIENHETLNDVVSDILTTLRQEGYVLSGKGDVEVVHEARRLDLDRTLPDQGVRPNDVVRVRLAELHLNG